MKFSSLIFIWHHRNQHQTTRSSAEIHIGREQLRHGEVVHKPTCPKAQRQTNARNQTNDRPFKQLIPVCWRLLWLRRYLVRHEWLPKYIMCMYVYIYIQILIDEKDMFNNCTCMGCVFCIQKCYKGERDATGTQV